MIHRLTGRAHENINAISDKLRWWPEEASYQGYNYWNVPMMEKRLQRNERGNCGTQHIIQPFYNVQINGSYRFKSLPPLIRSPLNLCFWVPFGLGEMTHSGTTFSACRLCRIVLVRVGAVRSLRRRARTREELCVRAWAQACVDRSVFLDQLLLEWENRWLFCTSVEFQILISEDGNRVCCHAMTQLRQNSYIDLHLDSVCSFGTLGFTRQNIAFTILMPFFCEESVV